MRRGEVIMAVVLAAALFVSAIAVVYSKHRSRELFTTQQRLERERDRLDVEWGRLRLEQGTWATHGRVESVARDELGLHMPARREIVVLDLQGMIPREER